MLPCMGMKRFTSHSSTPTTIRAIRICISGILFLPFCPSCETLPAGPLKRSILIRFQRMRCNVLVRQKPGLPLPLNRLVRLSFDILDACAGRGKQASGMNSSTNESFYCNPILGFALTQVCPLVYKFELCLGRNCAQEYRPTHRRNSRYIGILTAVQRDPGPGRITGGKRQIVSLLAYVPHVQESGVAGGCNLSSGFAGCTIQRGTNFFL
jgi:hypothetical protein